MKKYLLAIIAIVLSSVSCTENNRARNYGGSETIELNVGDRLVEATWKESDLWYLVKKDTTPPTTYRFIEKSSYGVWEGEIIFIER